jgi:hypothetical protein
MAKRKNKFKARQQLKGFGNVVAAKMTAQNAGDAFKKTLIEGGTCLVLGGVSASIIGRPSLITGIVVTFLGNWIDNKYVSMTGLGMMTAGGVILSRPVSGAAVGGLEGAKERVKEYADSLIHRAYLDKLIKKKDTAKTTNGVGAAATSLPYAAFEEDYSRAMALLEEGGGAYSASMPRSSVAGLEYANSDLSELNL